MRQRYSAVKPGQSVEFTPPASRYQLAQPEVQAADLIVAWGVPHDDMPYFMSACDALVFTSMQEGSPNAVKEALACNLPVVSVPVGDAKVAFTVKLSQELVRRLRTFAHRTGLSLSEIVSRALLSALKQRRGRG